MNLTNVGAFLGTVAFAAIVGIGVHQKIEVDYQQAHRSPTLIQMLDATVAIETGSAICSGYLSAKDHKIHTAAHCFEFVNKPQDAVVHFQDDHTELWVTEKVDTNANDLTDWATMVPKDKADIRTTGGLQTCTFSPYYGEDIVLIGAPLGIPKSISFGHVAKPDANGQTDQKGMIEIDVHMLPGNSGGPLIDLDHGCVIGTSEEVVVALPGSGIPFGVNFATPVEK